VGSEWRVASCSDALTACSSLSSSCSSSSSWCTDAVWGKLVKLSTEEARDEVVLLLELL